MSATALLIDGLIIVFYFVGILSIGLYMGRRENSLHDFALGGRNVPWWAVMASIIAAETSAATFLGAPGEGYDKKSLAYVQLTLGLIIGRIIVGYAFLKPYYVYKVYTVYDFLGIRFGPLTKNYVSFLFLVMRTLAMGARLFVPSLVIVLAWRLFVQHQDVNFSGNAVQSLKAYAFAIIALTVITCIYTALGGIKAVIWTDVIQAGLMFGSALVAIVTLLYHIGGDSPNILNGFRALVQEVPDMVKPSGYFMTGFENKFVQPWMEKHHLPAMGAWDYVKLILANDYTLFSALIGATLGNMAAFGTDQDMVQRMLTAETYQKSRRSLITAAVMDVPIAAAFTFIGILLFVYYKQDPTFKPAANSDVFGAYILNGLPVGIRGLVLAGVFATAMGSLSAALNALATSATNDWYIPYFAKHRKESHHVAAARVFTAVFALLMIGVAVAFAFAKLSKPDIRIIPVVLGIAGFILGPMLGVFLSGMFTKRRGSDFGNMIAVTVGLATTIVLGGLHVDMANLVSSALGSDVTYKIPDWLPKISFSWFAMIGGLVVCFISVLFATPEHVVRDAHEKALNTDVDDDRPVSLR